MITYHIKLATKLPNKKNSVQVAIDRHWTDWVLVQIRNFILSTFWLFTAISAASPKKYNRLGTCIYTNILISGKEFYAHHFSQTANIDQPQQPPQTGRD